MQVKETVADGLKHEFQVSLPAAEIDAKVDARLADMKDKVRINGFRPGKVPVAHLKKVYGRSVAAETLEQMIRDTNAQIFSERGFRLATEPKVTMPTEEKEIESVLAGESDLNYSVAIEVVPAIQLADFKTFTIEKPVADVTDADVDEAIKRIADQNRPYDTKGEGAKAENGELNIPAAESGALAYEFASAEAPAGPLKLLSPNESSVPHNIAIEGGGLDEEGEVVQGGGISEITVDVKAGEYTFYCSVPGHREGGMAGTLTVK